MLKASVIKGHRPESEESISCIADDILRFERRETTYPGWIWCMDDHGRQAWVPEAYVSISGDKCQFVREYNSKELEVQQGETVWIMEAVSGWAWVQSEGDEKGWVPLDCLGQSDHGGSSE